MSDRERLFEVTATEFSADKEQSASSVSIESGRLRSGVTKAIIGFVAVGSLYAVASHGADVSHEEAEKIMQNKQHTIEQLEAAQHREKLDQLEAYDAMRADRLREAQQEKLRDPHQNTEEVIVLPEEQAIQQHEQAFIAAGEEFDINPNYLATIAWIETCGNPESDDSSKGAEGMMQVMPSSAEWATDTFEIAEYNPSNPTDSIRVGAAVLALHMADFDSKDHVPEGAIDNYEVQFALYNGGSGQATPLVVNEYDRLAVVSETEIFLYEGDYILNELPEDGENTRCSGNPAIERARSGQ